MSDDYLLYKFRQGEQGAFEDLVKKYHRALATQASAIRMPNGNWDDSYQEALIAFAYAARTHRVNRGPFYRYFRLCVSRRLKSALSRSMREKDTLLNESTRSMEFVYEERGRDSDPEKYSEYLRTLELMAVEVDKLQGNMQKVFPMWVAGFTVSEISEALHIPYRSADNTSQRLRRKFERVLGDAIPTG